MAAESMLTTASLSFSPLVLLRPAPSAAASFAPPRRAATVVRAAVASSKSPAAAAAQKAATGITKPRPVSLALRAVVGTEALKRLWAYIKQNDLQHFP